MQSLDQERFCRLGEWLGDGELSGQIKKDVEREYKKLAKKLCPEIKEAESKRRKVKNKKRDELIKKKLWGYKCSCEGELKQTRKGSLTLKCLGCGKRYKVKLKKVKG